MFICVLMYSYQRNLFHVFLALSKLRVIKDLLVCLLKHQIITLVLNMIEHQDVLQHTIDEEFVHIEHTYMKMISISVSYFRKSRPNQLYNQHNYSSSNGRGIASLPSGLSNGTPSNSSLSVVKSCENVYESNVNTCPVII